MKLLIVSPEIGPEWGGAGAYLEPILESVRGKSIGKWNLAEASRLQTEVVSMGTRDVTGAYSLPLYLWYQVRTCRQALIGRSVPFDLALVQHAYMSDFFVNPSRLPQPIVVTVHSTISSQLSGIKASKERFRNLHKTEVLQRLAAPLLQSAEKLYLRGHQYFIHVSNYIKEEVHRILEPSFEASLEAVIPPGINLDLFTAQKRVPPAHPRITYLGRPLALKGLATLFKALRLLFEENPAIEVCFAGPGDWSHWEAVSRSTHLPPRSCSFLGKVPHSEVPRLLRFSTSLVLPSFMESSPVSVLEAMASGTPPVVSAVGGVPELIGPFLEDLTFTAGSAEKLADQLLHSFDLSQDNKFSTAMQQYAVEHFSQTETFRRVLRFLELVVREAKC